MGERAVRWAAPAAVTLFVLIGAASSTHTAVVVVASAAAAIVAALLLPPSGWGLLAGASAAAVAVSVLCSGTAANIGWFAFCVLAGVCSLQGGRSMGAAFMAVATVLLVLQWAVIAADPGWAAWIAGTLFTTVVCLMARRQHELIEQLRAAQAGLADRARSEERNRIARELHDVIGHALTVSLLHVTSARLAVEEDPRDALASLAEAERLGQQSLSEVRQAVGLLRQDDGSPAVPMPGAAQLPVLMDGFRRAGLCLSYDVVGDPGAMPATVGLTAYRILQEALTNVARHAPGARTQVRVEIAPDRTELLVDSAGAPGPPNDEGVGLLSMRERADALGGTVSAGPHKAGWRVLACLPAGAIPVAGDRR